VIAEFTVLMEMKQFTVQDGKTTGLWSLHADQSRPVKSAVDLYNSQRQTPF
jgi:hypothetical protein